MIKKIYTFIILALTTNFAQASKLPEHEKPVHEEIAPEPKQAKIEKAALLSSAADKATTSIAAAPAVALDTDQSASSASATSTAAEAPVQKQTSVTEISRMLDGVTTSKDVENIIFGYLDYCWWEEIKTLSGYNAKVTLVAYSRDGAYLASRSNDGKVIIWDVATGKFIVAFREQSDRPVHDSAITVWLENRYGKRKFAWRQNHNGKATVWDHITNAGFESYHEREKCARVYSVSWWHYVFSAPNGCSFLYSPDGQHGANIHVTNDEGTIEINKLENYSATPWILCERIIKIKKLTIYGACSGALAWSLDSKQLALGLQDKTIGIWDSETEVVTTLKGHRNRVTSVAFSADGNYLASGSEDGTIKIWQKKNWARERKLADLQKSDKEKIVSAPEISTPKTTPVASSAPASIAPKPANLTPTRNGAGCTIM